MRIRVENAGLQKDKRVSFSWVRRCDDCLVDVELLLDGIVILLFLVAWKLCKCFETNLMMRMAVLLLVV